VTPTHLAIVILLGLLTISLALNTLLIGFARWAASPATDADRAAVLAAIRDLGDDAYIYPIQKHTALPAGRIRQAVDDLYAAGNVRDEWVPQPDGKPARRRYTITPGE
jgi:hypothetical protein